MIYLVFFKAALVISIQYNENISFIHSRALQSACLFANMHSDICMSYVLKRQHLVLIPLLLILCNTIQYN